MYFISSSLQKLQTQAQEAAADPRDGHKGYVTPPPNLNLAEGTYNTRQALCSAGEELQLNSSTALSTY